MRWSAAINATSWLRRANLVKTPSACAPDVARTIRYSAPYRLPRSRDIANETMGSSSTVKIVGLLTTLLPAAYWPAPGATGDKRLGPLSTQVDAAGVRTHEADQSTESGATSLRGQ